MKITKYYYDTYVIMTKLQIYMKLKELKLFDRLCWAKDNLDIRFAVNTFAPYIIVKGLLDVCSGLIELDTSKKDNLISIGVQNERKTSLQKLSAVI